MSYSWEGGSDTRWRTFRAAILLRDRHTCTIAAQGCTTTATHVDHIVPLHMGGEKYDPTNCRGACESCNLGRKRAQPNHEPPHRTVSSW